MKGKNWLEFVRKNITPFLVILLLLSSASVVFLLFTTARLLESKEILERQLNLIQTKADSLNKLLDPTETVWLPDSLVFGGETVPLNNWYVRKRIKNTVKILIHPETDLDLRILIQRINYWFPFIEREIAKKNLPLDFKYLFVQESFLDIEAKSSAGALGITQFMAKTAKKYGLIVAPPLIDERLLPEKAIPAAASYLRDALVEFNDVFLAIASYNAGGNGIKRALRRYKGKNPNFFNINKFPDETIDFVYKIISWKIILENKERYKIKPVTPIADREYPPTVLVDTTIKKISDVSQVASWYNLGTPEFLDLNPHIMQDIIPPDKYTFRIPQNKPR